MLIVNLVLNLHLTQKEHVARHCLCRSRVFLPAGFVTWSLLSGCISGFICCSGIRKVYTIQSALFNNNVALFVTSRYHLLHCSWLKYQQLLYDVG